MKNIKIMSLLLIVSSTASFVSCSEQQPFGAEYDLFDLHMPDTPPTPIPVSPQQPVVAEKAPRITKQCSFPGCGKEFSGTRIGTVNSNMNRHRLSLHEGVKYLCDIVDPATDIPCTRHYARPDDLVSHMKEFHGKREFSPVTCRHCGYVFKRLALLETQQPTKKVQDHLAQCKGKR